jgi:hypothetical protein
MPESVRDRPSRGHEHLFLLAKSQRYFYDKEAIAEPLARPDEGQCGTPAKFRGADKWEGAQKQSRLHSGNEYRGTPNGTRNVRDVWAISPRGYSGAHFATFPPDLVSPCIRAGTSQHGVCGTCGAPWERVTETEYRHHEKWFGDKQDARHSRGDAGQSYDEPICTQTTGWRPTCDHDAEPVPAKVLDCFAGSGTVGKVFRETGRKFVGLDLNAGYLRDLALPRAENKQTQESLLEMPLFSFE